MAMVGISCGFYLRAAMANEVVAPGNSQVLPADDLSLKEEAKRRQDELLKKQFYFVRYVTSGEQPIELLVARSHWPLEISLWFETKHGTFAMKLCESAKQPAEEPCDSTKQPVISLPERRGEQSSEKSIKLPLPPGKYKIVVQAIDGARVHGVIGIKGPVVSPCPPIKGDRLKVHQADPPRYYWRYLLIKPAPLAAGVPRPPGARTLLVRPNNTPPTEDPTTEDEDIEFFRESAICDVVGDESANTLAIADSLGTPVLVPLFPRPELPAQDSNLQLQALTRASLDEHLEQKFAHVDRQLIAMIHSARKELAKDPEVKEPIQSRVLMTGFSASGAFTNRFTVLHPERVLAAAAGSPGGWPIAPVAADQGDELCYPVGIADVKELTGHSVDLAALRRVRFLFFLGDADTNDSVGYIDSFSEHDSVLINRRFGETLVARWWPAQRLYIIAGVKGAQFKLYHGVGHEETPETWNDVLDMFRKALNVR